MSDDAQAAEAPHKSGALNELVEIIKTVVYALLIALVLRVVFFQPFTIPSASMEPNLYEGDYIIVSKWSYGYSRHSIPFSPPLFEGRILGKSPERGDVAVFKLPLDGRTDYVKRIIGLPGDRIQVRDGLLFLNDKQVPREQMSPVDTDLGGYVREVARFQEKLESGRTYITQDFSTREALDNTQVFVVPEGHYFAMGDNRDNSTDSRVDPANMGVGMIPADHLVGKAQIIMLSWKPEASIFQPWTWILDARPSRFFKILK
ncbi:MAG: signal peptidase I [Phenylobacterium sp.]|jgi:signal peptidase I